MRAPLRLGLRAAVVAGAYLTTSAVVLLVILVLRGSASPPDLQSCLGFLFIATLAAGLEPATVKAAALQRPIDALIVAPGLGALLVVSAIKGLAVSPVLALVWRLADPHVGPGALAWLPLVCIVGFVTTDLRVLFDLEGRYALAIWLKQGSLAGGLLILAGLVLARWPLGLAIGVSTLARLALAAAAAWRWTPGAVRAPRWREIKTLFGDVRWMELAGAGVIAAVSGSADRVFGLRFLGPAEWAAYYLVYEVLSKFWFIPYMLGPIIFARRAGGGADRGFTRGAWTLTASLGLAFLVAVAGALALAPDLVMRGVGARFGWWIMTFAVAVVIGSFGQLRIAQLQASGAARRAILVMGLSAVFSATLFFLAARGFGGPGLLAAWLIKSLVELAAALAARTGMGHPERVSSV